MIIQSHLQGSQEWLSYRLGMDNASEASAMLGLSKNTTRTELLRIKSTGLSKEFSDYVQRMILDKGHQVEKLARPIVEKLIGEDLYPVVGSIGMLSASCDGLNCDDSIALEIKQWNEKYAEMVRFGELPEEHWPQCQQVLMVTGAKKLIFVVSDGTEDNFAFMWVKPDLDLFDRITAGWVQFNKDLAAYTPAEIVAAPVVDAIMSLPAINIQVTGGLTVSNLKTVIVQFDDFIDNANVALVTDDDFANGNATAKFSREQAKKLKACRQQIIDQVADISEATRIIDMYAGKFDALGLKLEKLVKTETENRKLQILRAAQNAYQDHHNAIEQDIAPIKLVCTTPNFAEAMKGKRTIAGWQDAVDGELANGKIAVDAIGRDIRHKKLWIEENHKAFMFLFNDLQHIIYKPFDDFEILASSRIEAHKKAEADKLEAQRLQIQAEEEAKAQARADKVIKDEADRIESILVQKQREHEAMLRQDAIDRKEIDLDAERAKIQKEEQAKIAEERCLAEQLRIEREKQDSERLKDVLLDISNPSVPTMNVSTPWTEPPTRVQMIDGVAFTFNVTSSIAEQWLIDEFCLSEVES